MLKKEITFENFEGEQETETHYFHLNKIELIELEIKGNQSFQDRLKKIIDSEDIESIFREFKEIILMSYGKRSEDGKRFLKSDEFAKEFEQSPAFESLIMEMIEDPNGASAFVNAIVPASMNKGPSPA